MIALNVTSSVLLAKRVVGKMVERRQGRVLVTSSIAGNMPATFMASFSEALGNELKDTGVSVTALAARD
jgi:short-subunit dehydrogenase